MTASELRELDAWIAENVMGFIWARDEAERRSDIPRGSQFVKGTRALVEPTHLTPKKPNWDGWCLATGKEKLAPNYLFEVPRFTTDKSAAMDVLEMCLAKMHERRRALEMMKWDNGTITLYSSDELQSGNKSLSLAIALFAKALFGKEGV